MSSATTPAPLQIFIPFWGDPDLLWATLDSVRAQTDPNWVVTVIDDCYPDPSVGERFARETDSRIGYQRNETNLGVAANFQRCLDLASGEAMMFLGCDDILESSFVARAHAMLASFPQAHIFQPGVRVIDDLGHPMTPLADRVKRWLTPHATEPTLLSGEQLATSLLRGNWLYWPSLIFRTDRVQQQAFRQDLPIILDLALVVDMVAEGAALVVDPVVTFAYRRHATSVSGAALRDGSRFTQDRRYFSDASEQMHRIGWSRAARAARLRWTSRLHALTLLPEAARLHQRAPLYLVLRHAVCR